MDYLGDFQIRNYFYLLLLNSRRKYCSSVQVICTLLISTNYNILWALNDSGYQYNIKFLNTSILYDIICLGNKNTNADWLGFSSMKYKGCFFKLFIICIGLKSKIYDFRDINYRFQIFKPLNHKGENQIKLKYSTWRAWNRCSSKFKQPK